MMLNIIGVLSFAVLHTLSSLLLISVMGKGLHGIALSFMLSMLVYDIVFFKIISSMLDFAFEDIYKPLIVLVGSIVAGIISFFLNTYYTGKKLHYSSWMQLKDIAPSYGIALTVALSVYFLKYLPFSCYLVLAIQIVVGLVVTFVICETLRPEEYVELKNISKKFIKKIVRKQ